MVYWGTFGEGHVSSALVGSSPAPMNQFVERLPWRVAALAGLTVGAISLAGGADAWTSLLRVSLAFLLFGLLGLALRAVLQQGMAEPPADGRGRHFDQTTPDETPDESASSGGSDVK